MTPLEFLNQLWQYKPEDQFILIWTQPDKRSRWFTSVPEAAEYVCAVNGGRDVYVGLGLSGKDYGPTRRCVSDEVTGISGIAADFDLVSDAHAGKALPATVEQALQILPPTMPPTIIVRTGNGVHCWWLLKEPYLFENEEDRKDLAHTFERWHTMLRLNAAHHGWSYDRLSDLARVFRVPSTRNIKDPQHPKEVTLHSFRDCRYNLSDFEDFLDTGAIPDREAEEASSTDWKESFLDKPLVVSSGVRFPQETLEAWMQADMRFRNTWHRVRHDLTDQSQSGYDLALACFGIDAGLTEQQIIDLVGQHRHMHRQKQRTRLDYFQRTIAKAMRRTGGIPGLGQSGGSPNSPPLSSAPVRHPESASSIPQRDSAPAEKPLDTVEPRKRLLAEISAHLGVTVVGLYQIVGKDEDAQYRMELEGGAKIHFSGYEKFTNQKCVRNAIGPRIKALIVPCKPKLWHEIANKMLQACIDEEMPEDIGWEGEVRHFVNRYLDGSIFIPSIESQARSEQYRPLVDNGRITIHTIDLQQFINRTFSRNFSLKKLGGALRSLGAASVRLRGPNHDQWRWALPFEFDPEKYKPHEAPLDGA
jgi:hypothetical protein